jgi:hypothetical protein
MYRDSRVARVVSITDLTAGMSRAFRTPNFYTHFNFAFLLQSTVWRAHRPQTVLDMVLRKDQLEVQLKDEHQLIATGVLRDESPLDVTVDFQKLCDACRVGDLKGCQEAIASGVNINARDHFDYTPLILVSCSARKLPPFTHFRRQVSVATMKLSDYSSSPARSVNEIPSKASDASTMP